MSQLVDKGVELNVPKEDNVTCTFPCPIPILWSLNLVLQIGGVVNVLASEARNLGEFWKTETVRFASMGLDSNHVCCPPLEQFKERILEFENRHPNWFRNYAEASGSLKILSPIGTRLRKAKESTRDLVLKLRYCKDILVEIRGLMNPNQDTDSELAEPTEDHNAQNPSSIFSEPSQSITTNASTEESHGVTVTTGSTHRPNIFERLLELLEYFLCRKRLGRDDVPSIPVMVDHETESMEDTDPEDIWERVNSTGPSRRKPRRGIGMWDPDLLRSDGPQIRLERRRRRGQMHQVKERKNENEVSHDHEVSLADTIFAVAVGEQVSDTPVPKVITPEERLYNVRVFGINLKDFLNNVTDGVEKMREALSKDLEEDDLAFPGMSGLADQLDMANNTFKKDLDFYTNWVDTDEKKEQFEKITLICRSFEDCLEDLEKIHEFLNSECRVFTDLWSHLIPYSPIPFHLLHE